MIIGQRTNALQLAITLTIVKTKTNKTGKIGKQGFQHRK